MPSTNKFSYFTKSYKHFGILLVIITTLISIPFTLSIISHQQDIKQHAAEIASSNCTVSVNDFTLDAAEQQLESLLNQYRQSKNLSALPISATLTQEAQWMANDMASSGNINSHTDSLGRSFTQRIGDCGYPDAATAADIVESGGPNTSAQLALSGWVNSPEHNVVILNGINNLSGGSPLPRNWQAMGIGHATNGTGTFTDKWVVAFGEANDGGNVPTIAPTPTFTPTPTVAVTQPTVTTTVPVTTTQPSVTQTPQVGFNFTVKIPGIGNTSDGANNNPNQSSPTLQVAMLDPSDATKNVANTTATLSYNAANGTFTGTAPAPAGTFHVKVRNDNSLWLDLGILNVTSGQITTVAPTSTVIGDLNQDNVLDLQDYNIFLSCYGDKQCDQKQLADVNQDGKVDNIDLNIFYSGLANRQGD